MPLILKFTLLTRKFSSDSVYVDIFSVFLKPVIICEVVKGDENSLVPPNTKMSPFAFTQQPPPNLGVIDSSPGFKI